jgi:proline iminopeptidase
MSTTPSLFPPIEPYWSELLPISDGHSLHIELWGSPHGSPAVVLHGGPGADCLPDHRRLFDPSRHRIVLFDQRRAGRSLQLGSVHTNTTYNLVADIETVCKHLGIEQWLVFGGARRSLVFASIPAGDRVGGAGPGLG